MKSAEERRALLEDLLQRVKSNRANLEQARLVEPAEPAAAPEPVELRPVESAPAVAPEPPVAAAEPAAAPEPPTAAEQQLTVEAESPTAAEQQLTVEAATAATAPVAAVAGGRPREWTIEAVLQRAWDLGARRVS